MAAATATPEAPPLTGKDDPSSAAAALLTAYVGVSFAAFLATLPRSSIDHVASLQSRNRILTLKLFEAEDQIRQLRFRRREDSKANARVAEIFATHRNAWQQEEKRLLHRIAASDDEITGLRARVSEMERSEAELRDSVERLEREVAERDEMLDFMSRRAADGGEEEDVAGEEDDVGGYGGKGLVKVDERYGDYFPGDYSRFGKFRVSEGLDRGSDACYLERDGDFDETAVLYAQQQNDYGRGFSPPPPPMPAAISQSWMADRSSGWQDVQYDSAESIYRMKHLVTRRESPWKVDGESTGVSSKLKLLEQELINLEKVGKGDLSKVPSLMRKQAKRYQSLAEKIDDLCRRMQVSDPCESALSPEFRTHRQTEFLLEAFHLQSRATETRQKLTTLQAETAKSYLGNELAGQAKLNTRKALDSIRNNFKEIQRNMEIWLARIMGDLEGILARDGASHHYYWVLKYSEYRKWIEEFSVQYSDI